MDQVEREILVSALNILRDIIAGDEAVVEGEFEIEDPIEMPPLKAYSETLQESKGVFKPANTNGKLQKEEKRNEKDRIDSPPLSDQIAFDVMSVSKNLTVDNGNPLNCLIIGEYTGFLAAAISDSFSGAGGRVLCLGDCLDEEGRPLPSWLDSVGNRFQKTIWPVAGDIESNFQGIDKMFDMVLLSTCGTYSDMASMVSKWAGFIKTGGVLCGTQMNQEDYPASFEAINTIFNRDQVIDKESGFWHVTINQVSP